MPDSRQQALEPRIPAAYPTLAMLGVLTMSSMAVFTVSVLAPEAAPRMGLDATLIGTWMAIAYVVAMFSGAMTATLIERLGAIRVCQLTLASAGLGLALLTLATPAAAIGGALLIGFAYGPFNPASAHVLSGIGTPSSRPFIFSVKQSGVPLGGALAGIAAPALALALGWRGGALFIAVLPALVILAIAPLRRAFDVNLRPARLSVRASIVNPIRRVLGDALLRRYTLVAFTYAGTQVTVGAFMAVYYVESLGYTLVAAGAALACLQVGAVAGRLAFGALAERWVASSTLLAILGLFVALLLLATAMLRASWPVATVLALGVALGACSFGWNGVLLSQIAANAPPGRVSEATGGMQFVMFGAVVVVPPLFGALVSLLDSFPAAFALLGLSSLTGAGLCLSIPGIRRDRSAAEAT